MKRVQKLQVTRIALVIMMLSALAFTQESSSLDPRDPGSPSLSAQNSGATDPTSNAAAPETDTAPIRVLGTPFPLVMRPDGLKLGPFYMTNVSVSGFTQHASAPGEPGSSTFGSVMNPDFILKEKTDRSMLAVQVRPYVSVVGTSAYLNQTAGLDYTSQLTPRLSLAVGSYINYLQNSYLQNPQYLLGYTGSGFVLQTISAVYRGSSFSSDNSFSLNYKFSGRTQVTFSPVIGANFLNQLGQWSWVSQLGGGVSVSRSINPNRTVTASYNAVQSINSLQGATSTNWTTQTFTAGVQQKIGQSWWITGSLGASLQQGTYTLWTPTGSFTLLKSIGRKGSVTAAYSRSRAAQVLLSSGYFDQADISYFANISRKWQGNVELGQYRTINTVGNSHGRRAGGGISYMMKDNCALFVQYNFMHQSGTNTQLFNGNNSYLSFGMHWNLSRNPGTPR